MHLVEDMSVPAHTRDDGHIRYNYEKWVLKPCNVNISGLGSIFFGGTVTNISSYFDTNQYTFNSAVLPSGNTYGLSEYTQANFFSEDTINDLSHFPYPDIIKTTTTERIPYPNAPYQRKYYLKECCGEIKIGGSIG
jgi:hypothetical protein